MTFHGYSTVKLQLVVQDLHLKDFLVGLLGLEGMQRDQPELWAFFGIGKLSRQHINPSIIGDLVRHCK